MSKQLLRWHDDLPEVDATHDEAEGALMPGLSPTTAANIGVDFGFIAGMRYALANPKLAEDRLAVLDMAIADEASLDLSGIQGRPS